MLGKKALDGSIEDKKKFFNLKYTPIGYETIRKYDFDLKSYISKVQSTFSDVAFKDLEKCEFDYGTYQKMVYNKIKENEDIKPMEINKIIMSKYHKNRNLEYEYG